MNTKPTQAQIEAALNAVKFCLIKGTQPFRIDLEILCAALTATAGDDTHPIVDEDWAHLNPINMRERCARVVDGYIRIANSNQQLALQMAAAAIRALKDKP